MTPAIRTQTDGRGEEYSRLTGTASSKPSRARQELKDDTDVNVVLKRFGIEALRQRNASFGETIDYDLDLQTALHAVKEAKAAHKMLPHNLRAQYPTWQHLLNALDKGELTLYNTPQPATPPDKPQEEPKP